MTGKIPSQFKLWRIEIFRGHEVKTSQKQEVALCSMIKVKHAVIDQRHSPRPSSTSLKSGRYHPQKHLLVRKLYKTP